MRALVLSDIHGNLEALEAVLAAAGEWDVLWNLGDMVGYGGSPNEVLDRIRPLSTLGRARQSRPRLLRPELRRQLQPHSPRGRQLDAARALARQPCLAARCAAGPHLPGHDSVAAAAAPRRRSICPALRCAHGSPLNEDTYILNMRDAWAPLQQMRTAITFVGHTHVQGGFWQRDHDWHEVRPHYRTRNEADYGSWPSAPAPAN